MNVILYSISQVSRFNRYGYLGTKLLSPKNAAVCMPVLITSVKNTTTPSKDQNSAFLLPFYTTGGTARVHFGTQTVVLVHTAKLYTAAPKLFNGCPIYGFNKTSCYQKSRQNSWSESCSTKTFINLFQSEETKQLFLQN